MSSYTMERADMVNQGWGDSSYMATIAENGGAPATNEAYVHTAHDDTELYDGPVSPHPLDAFFEQNPHLIEKGDTYDTYAIKSIVNAEQAAMLERQMIVDTQRELALAHEEMEQVQAEIERLEIREAAMRTVITMMKEFAADEEEFQPSVNAELHEFIVETLEDRHPELSPADLQSVLDIAEDFPPIKRGIEAQAPEMSKTQIVAA